MKGITVKQPWAWAIVRGEKDVENRTTNIVGSYRGPLAIIAGKGFDEATIAGQHGPLTAAVDRFNRANTDPLGGSPWFARRGAIIGVVDLVDVHSASVIDGCGYIRHDCPDHGTCRDHCSPWAEGPAPREGWLLHLVLKDPRPLRTPIPYTGSLGCRAIPADVVAQIEEQLA